MIGVDNSDSMFTAWV